VRFVSLHHHSTYSFLDGYGQPEDHVRRAAELGMDALALTEHGNMSSHVKLEKAAVEQGIKPIFGCELYCGNGTKTRRKNHLSVWAEDQDGYKNLIRMVSQAWGSDFYSEPTVEGWNLSEHQKGLIVASGCLGSLLATSIVGGKNIKEEDASFERGMAVASRFKELLGDRYYLEVQAFPELDRCRQVNASLERIGKKLKIPLVATCDVHYCQPTDNDMQVILHATRPGTKRSFEEQQKSWGYDVPLSHPPSDKVVMGRLRGAGLSLRAAREAFENTREISDRCTVVLPKATPLVYPSEIGSHALIRRWLKDGWRFRRIDDKKDADRYANQLVYELSIIEEKKFLDYFLFVSDLVRWAKDHGIAVGPSRGSSAASLVCYLLRITEIDPLQFPDLVFERFIDITRSDLPDIDLDFDDQRRHEVFDYLAEKYGSSRVGALGTFTTYKAKLALDDVARVHRVPSWEVDKIKELLLHRSSGDIRTSGTIEDTIRMFPAAAKVVEQYPGLRDSTRLEGMVKGMGRHAAGAVVSSSPLTEVSAIYGDKMAVDKYDAEYLNILKMDILGLNTIGMLSEAMQMMGKTMNDLYTEVPLDDAETIRGFKENDVVGVFQFDGRAQRTVNGNLKPDNFYEVCVINSLARPGPLHSRATHFYVEIKHGISKPEVVHPLFDKIVAHTQWQVVYQEQIIRIVREIGNFDWEQSMKVRRVISKKEGEQAFNRHWKMFWKGAKENGVDKTTALKIWRMCTTAGNYAFNAAHATSYGMIGWWCMWLKRHHPLVFFTAALNRLPDPKTMELLRDATRHGIKVLAPDVKRSKISWTAKNGYGKGKLRAGFIQIPTIGEKTALAIIDYRKKIGVETWDDLINVKGIGPKTILKIKEFCEKEDPLGIHILDKKLAKLIKEIESGKLKTWDGSRLPHPTHRSEEIPTTTGQDEEIVWIGVVTWRNLRDLFEVYFSREGKELDVKERRIKRPDLREWVMMHGYDGGEAITLRVDRFRYERFKKAVWDLKLGKDLVLARGIKRGDLPLRLIYVRDMWVFED